MAAQKTADLLELREAIENVDREILARIRERMGLVDQVAAAKLETATPFRDQTREDEVLRRVRRAAAELGLDPHEVERLYRLMMEMSIARQQERIRKADTTPLRVAYQGVEGSYSHLAAQRRYAGRPGGTLLNGYETFRAAVEAVVNGDADFALLPIENTTAGSINETYDLLAEGEVTITGEVVSAIEHCLLVLPGAEIGSIKTILSHPQALSQCESFLRGLPGVRIVPEFDTAGAARRIKEGGDLEVAAIASESAARVYGLEVLEKTIQDRSGNFTRFVEVAVEATPCPPDVPCKSSLLFTVSHTPGALGEVLRQFGRRGVNLSKLESRPAPDVPFQYRFYLDIEAHAASEPVTATLEEIRPLTGEVRLLGTYPRAE